jgi:hypothetical protein
MLPRCSFSVQKPHRSPPMLPENKRFCSIKSKISDSLQAAFCINFEWRPSQPVKTRIEGMGQWQRGAHGLPKVSLGPAMLDISMPCVKEYFKTWECGKGWLWTLLSNARACHALPFYALQVATPETALQPFQR